jgi:hypothetical protein
MPRIELKPIGDEVEFEQFCCEVAKDVFSDFLASRYGRKGQKQKGVDVRATDHSGSYGRVVIQCKFNKETNATGVIRRALRQLASDCESAADSLKGATDFDTFVYAGLWPSDSKLDDAAKQLSVRTGKRVKVWSHDDLQAYVTTHPRLQRLYAWGHQNHGVQLLDPDFLVTIQSAVVDPMAFYSGQNNGKAMQQWVGVAQRLDAPRLCASAIETAINALLPKIGALDQRVVAVVHGEGGSGKSTVLRRIAINQAERAVCWWITDLDQFLAHDAHSIAEKSRKPHLLFVEDWYRNVGDRDAKQFFNWLSAQKSVLVLVGDREVRGRAYLEQLHGTSSSRLVGEHPALHELIPAENSQTLSIVAQRLEELSLPGGGSVRKLINSHRDLLEKAPLFLALYVICHEAASQQSDLDLSDGVLGRFQRIIAKQLHLLEGDARTRGLGRALHLIAAIYSAPRNHWAAFSEQTLQLTASFFAEQTSDDGPLMNLESVDYPSALSALIYRASESLNVNWLRFNHDLIAEQGMGSVYLYELRSKTSQDSVRADWDSTGSSAKLLGLLDKLIAQKDAAGALQLLCFMVHSGCLDSQSDKWKYMLGILQVQAESPTSISTLALFGVCDSELQKVELAQWVVSQAGLLVGLRGAGAPFLSLLRHDLAGKQAARNLIASKEFWYLPKQIVSTALSILGSADEDAKAAARELLSQKEFWQLPFEIISTALNILGSADKDAKAAAREVLGQREFWQLPSEIISTALNILGSADKYAKAAAREVLGQKEFWQLPSEIISTALSILGSADEDAKAAARELLGQKEFWRLPHQIISTALSILGSADEDAKAAALQLLEKSNPKQTFRSFSALRILLHSRSSQSTEIMNRFLDDLYRKANPSAGEFRLRHDLLAMPLFFNRAFVRFFERSVRSYASEGSRKIKKNIYDILHCRSIHGLQSSQIEASIQDLCKQVSQGYMRDIEYQWARHPTELRLMHIALAFEILDDSSLRQQAIEFLRELAERNPGLVLSRQFQQLLLALNGGEPLDAEQGGL